MFGARRFVEDLLRQRRARRVRIDPESDAELRTAILLRSARVGADSVREDFVSTLHQRLAGELDQPSAPAPVARRRLIAGLGATAAASAVVGAGLDHVVSISGHDHQEVAGPPSDDRQLDPDNGVWTTVAASVDLPEGSSVHFDLGTVTGFVSRGNGKVWAVSGICTHLGCRLNLDAPARRLDCPCHGASFAVTGAVLRHRLPVALPPLPRIAVREINGAVQVFAPPRQGN
jgi:nitrite reductase/ring-hydroxylating ferredoxin subunit